MKILLETNFGRGWKIKDGEVELTDNQLTLKTLLEELSRQHPEERVTFIDPETNEIDPEEYLVMVNGGSWEFLPERLETKLSAGDRVSIMKSVEMLGGG